MTTYNTGNPVPSADARDRYDNSQTLDEVVNGDSESYSSRTGNQVISLGGMNSRFNNAQDERESAFNLSQEEKQEAFQSFLDGTGWSSLGAYGAGVSITSHTQTVDYQDQPYQLKPSIPVSLQTPYVTTGAWATEGNNFKLVGDNSLRQDLASPSGSSQSGYQRTKLAKEITTAADMLSAQKVSLLESWLVMYVTDRPDPNNRDTWDWGPALQAAIDYVLTMKTRPTSGVGVAYQSGWVEIPEGLFPIRTPVLAQRKSTTANSSDAQTLYITGLGNKTSELRPDALNLTMLTAESLRLVVRDLGVFSTLDNAIAGTVTAFKLGNENTLASVCQRCHFEDVSIIRVHKGIVCGIVHDSLFTNVYIGNLLGGTAIDQAVGFDVLVNAEDNSNFLTFDHLHIEPADTPYATLFRTRGRAGAAGLHQNFVFINPHFETRRYDTIALDLMGLVNSTVENSTLTRNTNGTDVPYTSAVQAVVVGALSSNIQFNGGQVHHSGADAADTPKLVRYEGSARHIRWNGTRFNPARSSGPFGLADILINNSTDTGMVTHKFNNCIVRGDQMQLPFTNKLQFNSPAQYTRMATWEIDAASGELRLNYTTSTDGSSPLALQRISPLGISVAGHSASNTQYTIAAGATATFTAPSVGGNTDLRGKYSIISFSNAAGGLAEFHSNGAVLSPSVVQALFDVATADPVISGKINVYMSGTSIVLNNRTGSTHTITIKFDGLM